MLFVLVHALVPHHHHENISNYEDIQEHEAATSLLDLVALSYHSQPDHAMEDYSPSAPQEMNIDGATVIFLTQFVQHHFIPIRHEVTPTNFEGPPQALLDGWHHSHLLRGPPVVIA